MSSQTEIPLTPTSYIVLGFLSLLGGEATPYDIKRMVSETAVGHFWPFPHSQLYAEPDRLAQPGYVTVRQEPGGRRRKLYKLTRSGREALAEWRDAPFRERFEIRDIAAIKLFFGADPTTVAQTQLEALQETLDHVEGAKERFAQVAPRGPMQAADLEIRMVHAALAFWSELAGERN